MSLLVKEPQNILEKGKKIPFKYCYVFDYSKGEILKFDIPETVNNNFQLEEYMEDKFGFKLSQIEYMTTIRKIRIKNLKDEDY